VSGWQLKIPFRSDKATVAEILRDTSFIEDEIDRRIARELVNTAALAGVTNGKQLRWLLEDLGAERRTVLDRLRQRLGLKSATAVDSDERIRVANALAAANPGRLDLHMTGSGKIVDSAAMAANEARSLAAAAGVAAARHESARQQAAVDRERELGPQIKANNLL
jgi:hypothetical protein